MDRRLARLLVIGSALIWGTSFPVIRIGLQYISSGVFLVLRFVIASLLLLILAPLLGVKINYSVLKDKFIVFTAILNGLGYALQFLGQKYTYATNAAILINTSPIFTAIFAHFLLGERLNKVRLGAIVLTFFGALLVIVSLSGFSFSSKVLGDILCLLAGVIWGLYVAESKKLAGKNYGVVELLVSWFFSTALIGFGILLVEEKVFVLSIISVLIILYVAVVCTVIAFLLWFTSLKSLEATTSSNYFMLEIIISGIIEYFFLGYPLTVLTIVGSILIIFGVYATDALYGKEQ